jgi:uncharacterized protein YidB (DUF937 family)
LASCDALFLERRNQWANLGALIKEFQQGRRRQAAQSWIGTGPNQLATRQSMSKLNSDIHADMRAFQLDDGRQQHSLALVVAQLPH